MIYMIEVKMTYTHDSLLWSDILFTHYHFSMYCVPVCLCMCVLYLVNHRFLKLWVSLEKNCGMWYDLLNFPTNEMVYLLLESRTCMPVQGLFTETLIDFDVCLSVCLFFYDVCFVLLMISCLLLRIDGTSEGIWRNLSLSPIFGTFIAFFRL